MNTEPTITDQLYPLTPQEEEMVNQHRCKTCNNKLQIYVTTYGLGHGDGGYKIAKCPGCGYTSPVDTNLMVILLY